MLQQADTTLTACRAALDDIRALLASRTPDAAFRSGVEHIIAEQVPPSPSLDWPPARLAPGSTWGEAAKMIAAYLHWNPGPATVLLSELAGTQLALRPAEPVTRQFGNGDRYAAGLLDAGPEDWVYERAGTLHAGPVLVASTRLVLLTDRLPAEAWAAIWAGQPCGQALGPYGMRRSRRRATAGDDGVTAAAVLSLGGRPAGLAAEHVPQSFCQQVASLANRQPQSQPTEEGEP